MAADNAQALIAGFARVVGNATTPPNGFIEGNLITSITETAAGVYNVQLASDISLQEFDLTVQLQGAASGMATVSKIGSAHFQVNTYSGANAAADRDFTLTIARKRVGG